MCKLITWLVMEAQHYAKLLMPVFVMKNIQDINMCPVNITRLQDVVSDVS